MSNRIISIYEKILSFCLTLLLVASNILSQSSFADSISSPDVFFSVDAVSIEKSGISKKIEEKYPFLREFAESLNEDTNKSLGVYDAMGLREEDFTHFSFRLDGLDSVYGANSVGTISLSQIYIEMNLGAKVRMDLTGFMSWLDAQLANELRSKKAVKKVLFENILDQNQLQFTIDLKELESSYLGDSQEAISLDSNFSIHINLEENQTNIRGFLTNPLDSELMESDDFEKKSLLSQMASDRQVSLYVRIPESLFSYDLRLNKVENPIFSVFEGVEEIACGMSFRDDSVFFQLILACKENSVATALEGLVQGSLGMARLAWMEDASARNTLDLIEKVVVQAKDNYLEIRLDITEKELGQLISNQLSSIAPSPHLQLHTTGPMSLTGQEAPSISLPLLSGEEFSLISQKGKVVVLDFWASWSRPCRTALPILVEVGSGYSSSEFCLMTINQDESQEEIEDFLESYDLGDLPVAMDMNGEVSKKYQVNGMPHTVIINQLGEVEKVWIGFSPFLEKDLVKEINRILGK